MTASSVRLWLVVVPQMQIYMSIVAGDTIFLRANLNVDNTKRHVRSAYSVVRLNQSRISVLQVFIFNKAPSKE